MLQGNDRGRIERDMYARGSGVREAVARFREREALRNSDSDQVRLPFGTPAGEADKVRNVLMIGSLQKSYEYVHNRCTSMSAGI